MALSRSWRVWINRWFQDNRDMPVDESVQPVVIVDDVRALSLRPIMQRFFSANSRAAGGAGLTSCALLTPASNPLRVLWVRATAVGIVRCGIIYTEDILGTFAGDGALDSTRLQSPTKNLEFVDATWEAGLKTGAVFGDDGNGRLRSGEREEIDTIVLPGQAFFISNETSNQLLTVDAIAWEQLPAHSLEQAVTSSPRDGGGRN
jgi:hypothetical protein